MTGRTSIRILLLSTAALLALPAAAAAQDDEPMLCAALDIAALAQDTGLEFESLPTTDVARLCQVFVAGDSYHGASAQFHEAPFEQTRDRNREAELFALGDHDAFVDTREGTEGALVTEVYVDFAPEVLVAEIRAPADAVAGQLDDTIAMTERLVAAIDELGLAPELPSIGFPVAEAAGVVIPAVDGVQFYDEIEIPEFAEALAAMSGIDPSTVTAISLSARPCQTCDHLGNLAAFRAVGADEGSFSEAVVELMVASTSMAATESEVGGKDVTVLSDESGMPPTTIYVVADTAYLILLETPHDAAVLEALP